MAKWKITKRCFYARPKGKYDKEAPIPRLYPEHTDEEPSYYESQGEDEQVPHYFEPVNKEAKEIAKKFKEEREVDANKFRTSGEKLEDTLGALKKREVEAKEAAEVNVTLLAKVAELESKLNKQEKKLASKK